MNSPDILYPGRGPQITDAQLSRLATVLDDAFRIPGTAIRFGLDPLIGLFPGIGDALTGLLGFLIVLAAWQRRLPKVTMARMAVNILIDSVVGAVPVVGDAFDVMWKSNRMNYNLLMRHRRQPFRSHSWKDWLFLGFVGMCVAGTALLPLLVLAWMVLHFIKW